MVIYCLYSVSVSVGVRFLVGDKLVLRQTSRRETERRKLHGDRETSRAPTCASTLPHRRSRRYEHLRDGKLERAQARHEQQNYSYVFSCAVIGITNE